jgi:conjugal transfer pilus assembly protein TraV
MRSTNLFLLMIFFCLCLQSCSSFKEVVNPYDEQFHCRAKDTEGRCVDTPTAYDDARHPQPAPAPGQDPSLSLKAEARDSQYRTITNLLETPRTPLINPPKILRVLILPYKGEKNELFMTRYAYLEIEKASWFLTDIKEN